MDIYLNSLPTDIQIQILHLLNVKDLLSINEIISINYQNLISYKYNRIYMIIENIRNINIFSKIHSYKDLYYEIFIYESINHNNHYDDICLQNINISDFMTHINSRKKQLDMLGNIKDFIYQSVIITLSPKIYKFLIDNNLILNYYTYEILCNSLYIQNKYEILINLSYYKLKQDKIFLSLDIMDKYYIFLRLCIMFIYEMDLLSHTQVLKKYKDLEKFKNYLELLNWSRYKELYRAGYDIPIDLNFNILNYIKSNIN